MAKRIFGSAWFWLSIVAAVVSFNVGRAVLSSLPKPPPVIGQVATFALTDQHGEPFGTADLRGKAWVANFIFTRCPTVCPTFTAKMASIQHRSRGLGDALHLVSFSVDPSYDTPARLLEYAKQHKASPRVWSFLTGPLDTIKATVVDGLKVAMGGNITDGNFEGIFHGSHFVLVDPEGRIRGYYESTDPEAIDRLLQDAGTVLNIELRS